MTNCFYYFLKQKLKLVQKSTWKTNLDDLSFCQVQKWYNNAITYTDTDKAVFNRALKERLILIVQGRLIGSFIACAKNKADFQSKQHISYFVYMPLCCLMTLVLKFSNTQKPSRLHGHHRGMGWVLTLSLSESTVIKHGCDETPPLNKQQNWDYHRESLFVFVYFPHLSM